MQYYFFHLMPWPHLPADFDAQYDSAWVWVPNSLYDPVKGHDLYREYINTLSYADELYALRQHIDLVRARLRAPVPQA